MSWLLDAELSLYDWANSSPAATPSESLAKLAPKIAFMASPKDVVVQAKRTSSGGGVLPPPTHHGDAGGYLHQWNTGANDVIVCNPLKFGRLMQTQTVGRDMEEDLEISNQMCDSHGSGGGEEERGGGGRGNVTNGGSSKSVDRLMRRREQNRRAAVNCRRKKRERATNSLMDYQKFQCSNTELSHDIRQLTDMRNRLLHQLTSICQRCASLTPPLPTTDGDVCED